MKHCVDPRAFNKRDQTTICKWITNTPCVHFTSHNPERFRNILVTHLQKDVTSQPPMSGLPALQEYANTTIRNNENQNNEAGSNTTTGNNNYIST